MGCPVTPLSCLDPVNIFAGVYNPRCGGFADPSNFQAERAVFSNIYDEWIQNYGVTVNYYINGFNLSSMNVLYGEHPTQEYSGPHEIKAYFELDESISLSRYGYESDDTITLYIPIKRFSSTMSAVASAFYIENGQRIEPKSDDLVEITSLGCDRPGNRGPKIFRVTECLDQSLSDSINPLMGHYVWKLTGKRYESDSSTNAPSEDANDQVYDNTVSGKLSSSLFPTLTADDKIYPDDIDTISKNTIYDMSKNDTSIYGEYY